MSRAAASLTRPAAASTTRPAELTLPGAPASVPAARQFTAAALPGCPRADDLILAVSELASNAVAHSASGQGGSYTLRIRTAPRWARAEIADSGPALSPRRRRNGFGLGIVAAVTDRSGATIGPDGTRTAFAEVTWPPP